MSTTFDRKLRQASMRLNLHLLLQHVGFALAAAGVLATAGALSYRILAWPVLNYWMLCVVVAFVALAAAAWWFVRRPGAVRMATIVDERMGTKERFSTALAMARSEDPFAQAALVEAHEQAAAFDPRGHFPLRPTRRWLYAMTLWAVSAGVLAMMPDLDVLGLRAQRMESQQKTTELAKAVMEIKEQAARVESSVKQLGDSQLLKDLDNLKDLQPPSAQDAKRQAIQKLGEMTDRVKELQKQRDLAQADALKEMFQQMKNPDLTNNEVRKIAQEIAKGQYDKAAKLLEELKKELSEGKLSDKEKAEIGKQLGELGKTIEEMAKQDKPLQDELAKNGQDKGLAEKTLEEIKEELKKQGLTDEQIQKIMEKASQCKSACKNADKLAEALKKLGRNGDNGRQLTPDELEQIAGELRELEAIDGQMELTDQSLEDLEGAIVALGEGEGQDGDKRLLIPGGMGNQPGDGGEGQGAWRPGEIAGRGSGSGGPGIGDGKRDTGADDGSTRTVKTRVDNPAGSKGEMIAQKFIKGAQVKGEARKQIGEIVQNAKDAAAQAISENQIPRKYEGAIKKYYGDFDRATGTPASGPAN